MSWSGDHWARLLPVGFVGLFGIGMAMPAIAETTSSAPPAPVVALGMTLPEYQGWGCLVAAQSQQQACSPTAMSSRWRPQEC